MCADLAGPATLAAFDDAEYADRGARVRQAMAAAGLDVLYLTSPPNILYLTGYEAVWYPWRLPLGLALVREPATAIFFDWTRHEAYARLHARCDELVVFDYADAVDVVTRAFSARGLARGRTVGLEHASLNPAAPVTAAVAASLTGAGATVVSGDWVVDNVRLYKSPAELARVRQAAAIADQAFRALEQELVPGLTEVQVSMLVGRLLADAGSDAPAQNALVNSGPTAWLDTHAFPSQRRLEPGDVVAIDACGVRDRYHANLCRTYSLGAAHPAAVELLEAAAGAAAPLLAAARIGEGPERAAALAEAWVRDRVPPEKVWWVGGYSLGLAFPPSWVGHTYLANDGLAEITWEPGYVSNFETVLVDAEAGFEAATIDTLVMTEAGLELLSELPRGLIEVAL
jgi:Xaa-Pro aminopeptidase